MADETNNTLYKRIKKRQDQLEHHRSGYEPLRKEVIEILRPELSLWDDTESSSKGKKRNLKVYSAAPEEAVENWSDGMQGHLVSRELPWFVYQMADKRFNDLSEVTQWRQDVQDEIYAVLRDSNFYDALGPVFRDAATIGDTVLWMDREGSHTIDFKTFHPRELYHATDVFHRKYRMTAFDAAKKFGKEGLSRGAQKNLENDPFQTHEFVHALYKKGDDILSGEKGIIDREWVSIYIETQTEDEKAKPLSIKGYHTQPYARWRYSCALDTMYGWGPGCSAIVDVQTLHSTTKTNMIAQQMQVDPPVMAHAALRNRLQLRPRGKTYTKHPERETVEPIFDRLNVLPGLDREDRLREAIDRRFNVDFFLMLARAEKPMTATEIIEKTGEKSILLGPKVGRMDRSLLNPTHERIFRIALDERWLPEPPAVLMESDGRIDIEYIGPLAQAQKRMFETRNFDIVVAKLRALAEAEAMGQAGGRVMAVVKFEDAARRIMRENDWPEDEINGPEAVEAKAQAQAQAQQAQMELEIAKGAADAVPKLQKPTEEGSPLAALATA